MRWALLIVLNLALALLLIIAAMGLVPALRPAAVRFALGGVPYLAMIAARPWGIVVATARGRTAAATLLARILAFLISQIGASAIDGCIEGGVRVFLL
jgi:hypothetical protein